MTEPLAQLRRVCRELPEAVEGTTVHHPSFKVRKKTFVMFVDGDDQPSVWVKSTHEEQQSLVSADPDRFFAPPYLGPKGWAAMKLDEGTDWAEVAELVADAYRLAAPKRLVAQLDQE